jgi:hypothetical protein
MSDFSLPGSNPPSAPNSLAQAPNKFTVPQSPSPNSPFAGQGSSGAASGANLVTIVPPFTQSWGVYYASSNLQALDIDTCVEVKFGQTAKISSAPQEIGAFSSYNVVLEPHQPKVKVAVGGQVRMRALMNSLQNLIGTTTLFNVVTPEITYFDVAISKYDYARTQKQGKNLLVAEITFTHIVQVAPAYSKTKIPAAKAKNPKSADKSVGGQVQSAPAPTIEQQNGAMSRQLFGGGAVTNSLTGAGVAQ